MSTDTTNTTRLFQRITNPKTGETIETQLDLIEAIEICSKSKSNFARDLSSKKNLTQAQLFWLFKMAEETHSLPQIKLACNLEEFLVKGEIFYFEGFRIYSNGKVFSFKPNKYLGQIEEDTFTYTKGVDPRVIAEIILFSLQPMEYVAAVGRKTGRCCICGRELTNAESIAAGIGPICAERF